MNTQFALVDCNSFFCSCERVARPHLRNKPVIVLSNNDGCIVSLTKEAKALGLKMGDVYFKIKDLCAFHQVHVFSSHFMLYGNISERVMKVMARYTPDLEVYSIDEAFLQFKGFDHYDLQNYCREIREVILQETSIPTGVGLAPTKVLSKVANYIAKKKDEFGGVVDLRDEDFRSQVLATIPIEEVWGVGFQSAKKLRGIGIRSAKDFRDYKNEAYIYKLLHKPGRQIQDELKGIRCFQLEPPKQKKSILVSRSFDHQVKTKQELISAFQRHMQSAALKLREEKQLATGVSLFLRTNPFKQGPQYSNTVSRNLLTPTHDSGKLVSLAIEMANEIFKEGYEYKKCGVMLYDFSPEEERQLTFLDEEKQDRTPLMSVADQIRMEFGDVFLKGA
jgi:DNA polymerase V